jgi:hypothetical protein
MPAAGFAPQVRFGFYDGDQWEPAVAADRFGHVYALNVQYGGVPGCSACGIPSIVLQMSADRGQTWGPPRPLWPVATGQWDPQIVVDPVDGKTVYAAWLQNDKSDILVGRSTDHGATWSAAVADTTNAGTDKPILLVKGNDVYVAYNHSNRAYFSFSHDRGETFGTTSMKVNQLGWALALGGTISPSGHVFFAWGGYTQNGGARGPVNLFYTRSADGGRSWNIKVLDVSGSPPPCPEYECGWAYLGAQMVMASDAQGILYALYTASNAPEGAQRTYFSKSTNGGSTWSARHDVSTAAAGRHHAFPVIAARGQGDVRVAWMDARRDHAGTPVWNVYYRASDNGGASWTDEQDVSSQVSGLDYIYEEGFRFPFGDYFEMDIDDEGTTHLVMGQGNSYESPGSVWYTRGH